MKKALFLLLVLALGYAPVLRAQDANHPYVHCVILDKTMSMTGHGGTDIWADVQNYCYEWIDGVPQSSTVLLFTFDKSLYGPQKFEIKSEADRAKIKDAVRDIKVDGRFTYISSNLGNAIDYVYDNYPKTSFNNRFYLITDGIEEEPESDFAGVMKKYSGKRGDYDYLFYVDLRDLAPKDFRDLLENTPGGGIGTGFAKSLTICPSFKTISFTIGQSRSIVQRLIVSDEELLSDMSFNVKVDSIVLKETNNDGFQVDLVPSMDIGINRMKKVEGGKYEIEFQMDILNGTLCPSDIYVGLVGRNQGDKILVFEPNGFCIKVRIKHGGVLDSEVVGIED